MIGLVSCVTASDAIELKPDILHMYILKSEGHITLSLTIVNLSCAVLGGSMLAVAEARPCSWVSCHCIGDVCPVATDTTASNNVLEFLCSCMKNTALSCEGLVMEHTMTISFSP